MKIIPAIDLMDGKVVRLYKGDPKNKTIYSDNPVEIAKKWESFGGRGAQAGNHKMAGGALRWQGGNLSARDPLQTVPPPPGK